MNARHSRRSTPPSCKDPEAAEIARDLQQRCPGWVIIWSPWRRAFTAFSAVTAESVVLDDPSVHRILQRIGEVQSAAWVGDRTAATIGHRP